MLTYDASLTCITSLFLNIRTTDRKKYTAIKLKNKKTSLDWLLNFSFDKLSKRVAV